MKIVLKRASKEEFTKVVSLSTERFNQTLMEMNNGSVSKTKKQARENRILPQGYDTPGHEIYLIQNEDNIEIGHAWIHFKESQEKDAYGYDIFIHKNFRGKGYGRLVLTEAKELLRKRGFQNLRIHVFADNHVARKLYKKMDFKEQSLYMQLSIQ